MSYRDVDELANRVAHAVAARLDGRRAAVALLFDHHAPVPAVILGVLETGGFVVPLDPSFPVERNRYAFEHSRAALVITERRSAALAASLGVPVDQVLTLEDIASRPAGTFAAPEIGPEDLASILYTSGSTGRPKGVMRTHRSLLRNVVQHATAREVGPGDRLALLFSYSGGASLGNVFTALLTGATLLPFHAGALGVERLAEWLRARAITSFHTVPTLFRHLTDVVPPGAEFPHLRYVQLGGERMFATDLERFKRAFGASARLIVGMGASEAGHLFNFVADRHTECPTDVLPLGYAVEDADIFLVDADRRPIGRNAVGEIAVRGDFVSPGYWQQPELSARTFVPGPDGRTRTFYTGDLGYMLDDGCVFFAGRADERVKIRGQAVELAEVEAALAAVDGIVQAAVVATGDPARLVACVAARPGAEVTPAALRSTLQRALPAAMVPASFVVMGALPTLPSGKIDRTALSARATDAIDQSRRATHVEARNITERALVALFAEVLDLEEVGIDDNFFELGGHSLPGMRLLSLVETVLGRRLDPGTLMTAPTVRELAAVILQHAAGADERTSLVPVQTRGAKRPFFWVHGERSNVFLPKLLGPDQPMYALVQQAIDGRPAQHTTVPAMAAYYRESIQRVQAQGPYLLGGFCVGAIIAFEIAQQLVRAGHEVRLLAMLDPPYRTYPTPRTMRRRLQRLRARAVHRWALARVAAHAVIQTARGQAPGIPHRQRTAYIEAIYSRARRRYAPAPYPGSLLIMRTAEPTYEPERVWADLARGPVSVRRLTATHDQIVFDEPHIAELAGALSDCLNEASRA